MPGCEGPRRRCRSSCGAVRRSTVPRSSLRLGRALRRIRGPASTQMVSWSMTSAASAWISVLPLIPDAEHPVVGEEEQHRCSDHRDEQLSVDEQQNAAIPATVILMPRMRGRSSPPGWPACTRFTSRPSTSAFGSIRRARLTEPSHRSRAPAGSSVVGLAAARQRDLSVPCRRAGRESPPEHADGTDQCQGSEDECDVHGFRSSDHRATELTILWTHDRAETRSGSRRWRGR